MERGPHQGSSTRREGPRLECPREWRDRPSVGGSLGQEFPGEAAPPQFSLTTIRVRLIDDENPAPALLESKVLRGMIFLRRSQTGRAFPDDGWSCSGLA
jgi:hypothetical protein